MQSVSSDRRLLLKSLAAGAVLSGPVEGSRGRLTPCIHQATTTTVDFKTAMEAYGKAGFRFVEPWLRKVEEYLPKSSLAEMKRILKDNGLKPVSAGGTPPGIFFPRLPDRDKRMDGLKRALELCRELEAPVIVSPSAVREPDVKADDYRAAVDVARQIGEIARSFRVTIAVECIKGSTFLGCLTSVLELCRKANHEFVRPMVDTFHLYAGIGKLEELDALRQGELLHLHIDDIDPAVPRELLADSDRVLPGEGIIPLGTILAKLKNKGYTGVASLELFNKQLWQEDPVVVARKAMASLKRVLG
ncbi:MAG: sugar phosphate isomerase/epimerase [Acidobacteria bacterium]|nr:sugar phosphate isomerase/epimerase [Acidobacteriota bacterium]